MALQEGERLGYQQDLTARLSYLLRLWSSPRLHRALVGTMSEELNETDGLILWELGLRGPLRAGRLAQELSLGAPGMTKATGRLSARGLIDVTPDSRDNRARLLTLTPAGRTVAAELFRVGDRMITTVTEDWSKEDVSQLTSLLTRLAADSTRFAERLTDRDA